ncbi:MAG: S1 RNA-binding domain-containing protein, partial [Planctomycetota bacterium]
MSDPQGQSPVSDNISGAVPPTPPVQSGAAPIVEPPEPDAVDNPPADQAPAPTQSDFVPGGQDAQPSPDDAPAPAQPSAPVPAAAPADPTKETFRTDTDAALDAEVDAIAGDLNMEAVLADAPDTAVTQGRLSGLMAGTVVSVDQSKGDILVDLGGKHQAVVPLKQFDAAPEVGEFVEVEIEKFDAAESLYKANKKGSARSIGGLHELKQGMVVEAVVVGVNKGGLDCRVGPTAIKAFMPAGQVDTVFHKDISIFIDQKFAVRVTKLNKAERNVIVSRRAILEAERGEAKAKLMRELEPGSTMKGTVKSVKDFGAFVDIGGADALLHV